jgi:hypothetical protein
MIHSIKVKISYLNLTDSKAMYCLQKIKVFFIKNEKFGLELNCSGTFCDIELDNIQTS